MCVDSRCLRSTPVCPRPVRLLFLSTDKYEGIDMRVDSHWSEKKREHMSERDWRIFRCPIMGSGCCRTLC